MDDRAWRIKRWFRWSRLRCLPYDGSEGDPVGLIAQIWPHASPRLELASSHTNSSLEVPSTFSSSIGIERRLRQSW